MHCYGYPLQNTPYADSLIQAQELIPFTDVVSPASATIQSNTRSLTFFTHEEGEKPWYQFPSIIQVLRQAGYATAWIANQRDHGRNIRCRISSVGKPTSSRAIQPSSKGLEGKVSLIVQIFAMKQFFHCYSIIQVCPIALRKHFPQGLFQIVHLMGSALYL